MHLPPKELAALRLLLDHAGQIVTPQQLREALWSGVHVTADSVPKCVSSLRARLESEDCIQTVYKRGYRFSAELVSHSGTGAEDKPRLTIVPFKTEFGVPEHLGTFVAEEAMNRLARVSPAIVSVLAQDSVFTLAHRGLTALEVGTTLKADFALAGSIRALPAHYRLRVELIRIPDGTQVWIEDMLVERSSIAGLESELARQLVFRLGGLQSPGRAELEADDKSLHSKNYNPPRQREAYELYQRAHHEWRTMQRHRMQDGLQHLLRATEMDPTLLDARTDLINLCMAQELLGFMSPAVADEIVQRTAGQISNLELHAERILPALGWMEFHLHRDMSSALRFFAITAHLPHDAWITRMRVMLAMSRHRFEEAIEILRAAIRVDPCSPWLFGCLAWALHLNGEAAASVDQVRSNVKNFGEMEGMANYGATVLAYNGLAEQAVEMARGLTQRLPYFDTGTSVLGYALACGGQRDEARQILERLQWLSRERYVLNTFSAPAWVVLGEPDMALEVLRAAGEANCPWYFQILADPRLKPLEDKPDFQRMRLDVEEMEASAEYV
ncbi:winged helix-turn-helix domain-containing protein [Telmatobacter bradus]|uniref:winged helix-turn-helix domain-containing protein n=1 Tax=Telmatobacter bradus TaxID=474953 RepID=UPI003B439654